MDSESVCPPNREDESSIADEQREESVLLCSDKDIGEDQETEHTLCFN